MGLGGLPFWRLKEPVVISKKEKIKTQFAFETLAEELHVRRCHFERRQMRQWTQDRLQESILTCVRKPTARPQPHYCERRPRSFETCPGKAANAETGKWIAPTRN